MTGLIEKAEDKEKLQRSFSQIWIAALGNSSHPYQSKKTKPKKKNGYPEDYTANVQLPSGIGQFSFQLTSHRTVEMEQFAKDRNLLS